MEGHGSHGHGQRLRSVGEVCALLSPSSLRMCWCSCGEEFEGEYCEFDNPCSPRRQRCLNGGSCRLSESVDGAGSDARCDCPVGMYSLTMT